MQKNVPKHFCCRQTDNKSPSFVVDNAEQNCSTLNCAVLLCSMFKMHFHFIHRNESGIQHQQTNERTDRQPAIQMDSIQQADRQNKTYKRIH